MPNPNVPQEIADNAQKLIRFITHQPEGMLHGDTDAHIAFCQTWFGPTRDDGQAFVHAAGARIPIHRFAYLLWVGDVPDRLYARPLSCGTALCVSPNHLELVPRGYGRRNALTPKQCDDIRWFYNDEDVPWTQARLARAYGVTERTISRVVAKRDA